MNCRHFSRILADFQEGSLSPGERSEAEAHLEVCSACRRLRNIARGSVDILPGDNRDELARSILGRTSGSACPRVESELWDYLRGELNKDDSELTALHLDHCAGCKAIARNLAMMQQMLPTMAEIDPGESFTREVVRATSGQHPGSDSRQNRLLDWWHRVVQRPRFSLEAAYLGTLILVFCFSSFFMAFRHFTSNQATTAANQTLEQYLSSVWVDVKTPFSGKMSRFSSLAASGRRVVSESLSKRVTHYENASASMLDKNVENIREWRRKATGALVVSWTRLSNRIPQSGK